MLVMLRRWRNAPACMLCSKGGLFLLTELHWKQERKEKKKHIKGQPRFVTLWWQKYIEIFICTCIRNGETFAAYKRIGTGTQPHNTASKYSKTHHTSVEGCDLACFIGRNVDTSNTRESIVWNAATVKMLGKADWVCMCGFYIYFKSWSTNRPRCFRKTDCLEWK